MTGDLVHVVVTAVVPEGDDVTVPEQELGTFELHDHRYQDQPIDDGRKRRFRFELESPRARAGRAGAAGHSPARRHP